MPARGSVAASVRDAGGKIVFPVTKVGPTTTIALFSGLDGNVIGLTDGK
jgi:predicted enzyme related to lactoylglutathione lyase